MHIYVKFLCISFFLGGMLFFTDHLHGQSYADSLEQYRINRNKEMIDTAHSPLKKEEILKFKELHFYPANSNYRISADFIKNKRKETVTMTTSSGKEKQYYKIGKAVFELNGVACTLTVFQPVALKNYIFIPFTDLTNSEETYGGGRYLDATIIDKKKILIDFNYCYNPYCAYTSGYSCPIPPTENFLNTAVKAGEKLLWDSH